MNIKRVLTIVGCVLASQSFSALAIETTITAYVAKSINKGEPAAEPVVPEATRTDLIKVSGVERGVFEFDLSTIPAGAVISKAEFLLVQQGTTSIGNKVTFPTQDRVVAGFDAWADLNVQGTIVTFNNVTVKDDTNTIDITTIFELHDTVALLLTKDSGTNTTYRSLEANGSQRHPKLRLTYTTGAASTGTLSISPSHASLRRDANRTKTFTVTNTHATDDAAITTVTSSFITYTLENDTCSNATLPANTICTFDVKLLSANSAANATDYATVTVTAPASTNAEAVAFISVDSEPDLNQARRKLPPVIENLAVIDNAGQYDFTFDAHGYDDSYEVIAVLYDCSVVNSACAANSVDNIANAQASAVAIEDSTLAYKSNTVANKISYSVSIPNPAIVNTGVLRIFYKTPDDDFTDKRWISATFANDNSFDYVDVLGRKVIFTP